MTDRMTLDEAREKRLKAIKERLWVFYDLRDEQCSPELVADLALLDHLAARVEAGEAAVGSAKQMRMYALGSDCTTKNIIEQFDAALARWEGLSK